jgi:chorismate mutase/prephenate dehydratase
MTEPTVSNGSIEELRKVIDATDAELFGLLEKRAKLARSIGKLKAAGAVYKPEREREIFERTVARAKTEGTLMSEEAIRSIVREIISACRAVEAMPRVAFLGPRGTFTEEAVIRQFGSSIKSLPCGSLDEVFHEAASGTADFAVVPVENSTEGIVTRTADLLLTTPLKVIGEVNVAVHHNLMNRSGKREDIVEVHAHPQALAQCRLWLMTHLPQAKLVPSSSNAQAAKEATADPKVAALAVRLGSLCSIMIMASGSSPF